MNKIFLEYFEFIANQYISDYNYTREERNKLISFLFLILKRISNNKQYAKEIKALATNFIINFYDKPQINFKLISFALVIKNSLSFDYGFLGNLLTQKSFNKTRKVKKHFSIQLKFFASINIIFNYIRLIPLTCRYLIIKLIIFLIK